MPDETIEMINRMKEGYMPDEKPIVINPSPAADQGGAATRDFLLIISVLPAAIAVLGTRDVKQIVDFISSAQFAPVLGLIIGAGTLAWRQIVTRNKKKESVTIAEAAPNSAAVVMTNAEAKAEGLK